MKKAINMSALILALVIMCLCFSGCDKLDQAQARHATWTTPKSIDSITYNGKTYIKVDDATSKKIPSVMYNNTNGDYVKVSEPDVPVLWTKVFASTLNISVDENFIEGDLDYIPYSNKLTGYEYSDKIELYCNEEIYEQVKTTVESGINYTSYGYEYEDDWDKFGQITSRAYYYLKPDETNAVNEVFDTVEHIIEPSYEYEDMGRYLLELDKISDDKLFGKSNYEIYQNSSGTYSLVRIYLKGEQYMQKRYTVPEHLTETFDKLTKKAKQTSPNSMF